MRISHHLFKSLVMVALFLGVTGSCFAQTCKIVAEAATESGNGIAEIPPNGATAFALSTTNVGQTCNIFVGAIALVNGSIFNQPNPNLKITLCQTNPQNAVCFNPNPPSSSVTVSPFSAGGQPTFSVFLQATGTVPSGTQVCVLFIDQSGNNDGQVCVPVETT